MSQVPPPPPSTPYGTPPTEISGQQTNPSTVVPGAPAGGGYAPVTTAPTNQLAIISLIAGVGSFFAHIIPGVGGFTVALVAVITGFMARNQIKQTNEQGIWMANLGIIIGFVHIALIAIVVLVFIFFIFVLGVALFGIGAHSTPTPAPSG
ncbi:MAG TPA: DUF4190 domain-containing protein [Candidatus Dormibacteraeota bacterium]|nr:DUF4190 domain-containing protein [Candidatus Dormibacteraeota bacterium]